MECVRVGQSRGHYVQGREQPTIIDHGTVTFTNQRVVFLGSKWTREWTFTKLLGIQHFSNQPWTAIQVSNRQKTSAFTYGGLKPDIVRLWLEVALAAFHGQPGDLLSELTTQLRAIAPPPPLPMGPAESTPPGMWPGAR